MSKRNLLRGLLVIVVAMGNVFARAQKPPPPAPDLKAAASSMRPSQLTEPILARIENIEQKMVAIAELFPDDLYNTYRPKENKDVRTAAEILLHVAGVGGWASI